MLASPQQSRSFTLKHDRVIAAPFQNAALVSPKSAFSNKTDKPGFLSQHVDFRTHTFAPLEPARAVTLDKYCGPTTESNWVIPGVLLVGAYPASEDDTETFELISSILKLGIRKFACLQLEYRADVTPEEWRTGRGLRPYFEDVKHIVQNKNLYFPHNAKSVVSSADLSFDHLPIVDCGVTDDDRVLALCRKLVQDITRGEVIYLHCWGGHGRTGTVVSIMLHLMYGMSATEAMARCQMVHDLRICPVQVGSPQTQTQRDQVTRIVAVLQQQYKREKALFEAAQQSDSLNSTVRISRSGSSDQDDESSKLTLRLKNAGAHNSSFTSNRLARSPNSFTAPTPLSPIGSVMSKQGSKNSMSDCLTPIKSAIVADTVMERSTPAAVAPLPATPGVDFHATVPRPDTNSPQKKQFSQSLFSEVDSNLASTFHRQVTRSPADIEGLSGVKALSVRTPSSDDRQNGSFHNGSRSLVLETPSTALPVVDLNLEDLLPEPGAGFRPSSAFEGERQLSTASQPMSVSSEISEGTIKRNISCTLTGDMSSDFSDDGQSMQVRKASATNMNNHAYQQKEPISQPSGGSGAYSNTNNNNNGGGGGSSSNAVSYTISQVLSVARQVLMSGGRTPTNGSSGNSSPTASSRKNSVSSTVGAPTAPAPAPPSNGSPRSGMHKTPTPPVGTPAPSSKSSRSSRN